MKKKTPRKTRAKITSTKIPRAVPVEDNEIPTKMDITVGVPRSSALFEQPITPEDIYFADLIEREINWPTDWWQHFKLRWFPCWALNRWPVQYEVKKWRERSSTRDFGASFIGQEAEDRIIAAANVAPRSDSASVPS